MSLDENLIRRFYQDEGKSLREVAKTLGVSAPTLSRYMKKYGIVARDKAQAQKNYLNNNEHQMKGRSHSDETKQKISNSIGEFWESLSHEEEEALRAKIGSAWKKKWASMSQQARSAMIEGLSNKAKESQGDGSRFERFVAHELRKAGYLVEERTTNYTAGKSFEIDIALPKEKIAIEIDGPSHFLPIYGEKQLFAQQERDERKNKMVNSSGYSVLRIRDNNGAMSKLRINKIIEAIKEVVAENKPIVKIIQP